MFMHSSGLIAKHSMHVNRFTNYILDFGSHIHPAFGHPDHRFGRPNRDVHTQVLDLIRHLHTTQILDVRTQLLHLATQTFNLDNHMDLEHLDLGAHIRFPL